MSSAVHTTVLRIGANHPSLPGHFPGQPIVPGVVLLDGVLRQAEHWLQCPLRVAALSNAKFTAPLLPEMSAQLQLTLDADQLRFSLTHEGMPLAQGLFQLASKERAA